MLRILKSIQEFEESTCRTLGDGIQLKKKGSDDVFLNGIITGYYYEKNIVSVGLTYLSLKDLCKNFLFLDLRGKWREFGIEEKPAKFKVGEQYTGTNSNNEQYSVVISAKYRDPKDDKVRVVVSNRFLKEIYTDKDDNERFILADDVIKAENKEDEIGF